ncbi:NADH--cytochrome b5 reductase 1 isoform X3 [Raphanus sativus]|uniref:NADH--cytochrome b5 reductase 1 isoform X3 n=1 Tax=Raphanus sativus TaxID=3726 RepID=A0A9W3D1F7_RAPSA|nr:NADH--cytochrome b5 reductase 1 isoform X3 [Raphanus sativus]
MDTEFLRTLDRQILLGVFVAFVAVSASAAYCLSSSKKRRGCLDPENFKEFKLVKKQQLSHNVAKLVFELPSSTAVLGLPIGQHISCRFCSSMSSSLVYLSTGNGPLLEISLGFSLQSHVDYLQFLLPLCEVWVEGVELQ